MNSKQIKQLGIKEIYLPIDGFHNYEVSNYGNVRNSKTGRKFIPCIDRSGYYFVGLYHNNQNNDKKRVYINIHRLVLTTFESNYSDKNCVDHIDNNRLNNCLFNLRFATRQENQCNRIIPSNNISGVKGVHWKPERKKWCSQIMTKGKSIHIGYFDNLEDAKQARQNKARELFGEYLNKCEV
jgi:hypothetical protein